MRKVCGRGGGRNAEGGRKYAELGKRYAEGGRKIWGRMEEGMRTRMRKEGGMY